MDGDRPMRTVIVVGAGMAGLTAARRLQAEGLQVTVVDKSRAVGGRMASKRIGPARFDTGAQHFSVRSPEFVVEVGRWLVAGVARVWYSSSESSRLGVGAVPAHRGPEPRHAGSPAMRSIAEHLADGLDVELGVTIDQIAIEDGAVLAVAGERTLRADACIVTAPVPQVVAMLGALAGPEEDRLRAVRYEPCLAAMLTLSESPHLPDGHLAVHGDPVAWLADNQHKGVSTVPAVTVHSSYAFARDHLEEPPERFARVLADASSPHLGAEIVGVRGHRWRFALPIDPSDEGAVMISERPPIVVAGEAFSGARVEGAFLSGVEAARRIADRR